MVCYNFWNEEAEKMDKDRKDGTEKLSVSNPNFLERFLSLFILLELLDFFLLMFFLTTHGAYVFLSNYM